MRPSRSLPHGPASRSSWLAIAGLALAPLVYFWRGALGQVLLAPVDGLLYSFPSRLLAARLVTAGALPLWNPYVFSGFPLFGEMQTAVLYPGAWLFYVLPPVAAMNGQMLLTYSLAALGTYAYTRALGCLPFAAGFAGLTFAFGGFMPAHLGHVATPQGAACLPWLLWSLERLRITARFRVVLVGAAAVAVSVCAGHPPIPMYLLIVGGVYVVCFGVAERPAVGRTRYLLLSGAIAVAGISLVAVQLVPAAELAAQSVRAQLSYSDFTSYSLPPAQLPLLLFPFFFGGSSPTPYWGAWNLAELTGYVGAAPLMLAAAAMGSVRRNRQVAFWGALALVALVLVLGDGTPLARVMYHVPVYRLFRAQARNLLEVDFALAVLAALGLSAATPRALRCGAVLVAGGAALFALVAIVARPAAWSPSAAANVSELLGRELTAWRNPRLLVPLAVVSMAAVAVSALARRSTPPRRAFVLAVQAIDLFVFNALMSQPTPNAATVLDPPAYVRALHALDDGSPAARVALVPAGRVATDCRHALWGVETVNGYDPFMLSRYGEFANDMPYWGELSASSIALHPRFLDLANARYAVVFKGAPGGAPPVLDAALRSGGQIELAFASPLPAGALEAVTYLGGAVLVEQGTPVARITLLDDSGGEEVLLLRAGEQTAEWAWDDPTVTAGMRHRRAPLAESFTVGAVRAHSYRGVLPLARPRAVARMRIEYLLSTGGLVVSRLALIDPASGRASGLAPLDLLRADATRWEVRDDTPAYALLENRRVLPRAWLVGRTTALPAGDVLNTVRDGQMPDGRPFDPAVEALVETGTSRDRGALPPDAAVAVVAREPNALQLSSDSPAPAFLVLSEIFYPGWHAFVDDAEVPIERVDYVLRGLDLPAGAHRIRIAFDPLSLRVGAAISAVAVLLLLAIGVWRIARRR